MGKRYKRVVLPLVIKGPVKCESEEVSSPIQVDAEPFAELVLELQTRLCPPQLKKSCERVTIGSLSSGNSSCQIGA